MKPGKYLRDLVTKNEINYKFYELDNVIVEPSRQYVFQSNNFTPNEYAARFQGLALVKYSKTLKKEKPLPEYADISYVSNAFLYPSHHNFYHLMIDCLPRLWSTFQKKDQRIVICKTWLDMYPLFENHIKNWIPCTEWVFTEAHPDPSTGTIYSHCLPDRIVGDGLHFYSSDDVDRSKAYVHNKILAAAFWQKWYQAHYETQKQERKIFLARTLKLDPVTGLKIGVERCSNQEEIFEKLKLQGFEWMDPMNYSFEETAKIINSAETIVGVHGAGLANTVFCQPNTKYIQLANNSGSDNIYQRIAEFMLCNYRVVYGKDAVTGDPVTDNQHGVFIIEPQQVLYELSQL